MKSYYGNYLGMVINNNDPEYRGRVQIFVPHIMPTLYENWNQKGEDLQINCVGDNMPQGLQKEIVEKLKLILPWAEAASPIVGQGVAGGVWNEKSGSGQTSSTGNAGSPAPGYGLNSIASSSGPTAADSNAGGNTFDQTPTAAPVGNLPPGDKCDIPIEAGVNVRDLKTGFVQRLNSLYREATALGYKITCSSGYRSPEKQSALYNADLAKNGGKPSGAVARPGSSVHELGIAADLKVTGNGVSITQIRASAERDGTNRDTPEWRQLLAKHGLHQPLHPKNVPVASVPESWHIEPIETPKAKQGDRIAVPRQVAQKLSEASGKIGETTSSSQFPAIATPQSSSSPSGTDTNLPNSPKTGQIPTKAEATPANPDATPTNSAAPSDGSKSQLAQDRTNYFRAELSDPQLLDRIEFVTKKEGGSSGRLIFETACNRAMFGNKTLKFILFQKAYFKDPTKDPNANKTTPHTQFTLNMIRDVIYNGANETDLATDQAYNDKNLFAKKFIDAGAKGSWFDLLTGKKITDPARINKLSTSPGSGNEEFIYQKSGHGSDASSTAGKAAKIYGEKYNIQPTSPSTFAPNVPLPDELKDSSKSPLTGEPHNTLPAPKVINNVDSHGPTIVKNTNDAAKGLFAFPGVGAMIWVFFREGNPLFPVYFAASYGAGEWKSAYSANGISPVGDNHGNVGPRSANSMKLNPNAGGGLEFTHIKDATDPSGAHDKAVAMIYGDDGSNMVFTKGYHQIYTRHDRRDQIDGHSFSTIHGSEERWIDNDSSINVRGNVLIKVGKIDSESMEAMKELSDFSAHLNETLMSNKSS